MCPQLYSSYHSKHDCSSREGIRNLEFVNECSFAQRKHLLHASGMLLLFVSSASVETVTIPDGVCLFDMIVYGGAIRNINHHRGRMVPYQGMNEAEPNQCKKSILKGTNVSAETF